MIRQLFSTQRARGTLAAILVSLAGAGFSAHAGLSQASPPAIGATLKPVGYEADDHFPGAALLYAADATAPALFDSKSAPRAGVTGTAPLPDLPIPQNAVVDDTVRAARPFVLSGDAGSQARALQCLTTAIYYEAASESDDGQAAVAQVILNRVRHPAFPNSVCGVVYQGSERAGCQFSFACDGAMARIPMKAAWERARRNAALALSGRVLATVGLATHYHTYAVRPSWQKSLVMTDAIGAHFFHRWKGWWGTLAAFSQSYAGREPTAEPHPRVVPLPADPLSPVSTLPAPAIAAVTAQVTKAAAANVVKGYTKSGDVLPQYADVGGDSQILDKWKDAGKPLR